MSDSEWEQAEGRLRWAIDTLKTDLGPANWYAIEQVVKLQTRLESGERNPELLREILALE